METPFDIGRFAKDAQAAPKAPSKPKKKAAIVKATKLPEDNGRSSYGAEYSPSAKKAGSPDDDPSNFIPEEYKRELRGYEFVPQSDWIRLRKGSHLKYMRTDGSIVPGGFMIEFGFDEKHRNVFKFITKLDEPPSADSNLEWIVCVDNIKYIWKRSASGGENIIAMQGMAEMSSRLKELESVFSSVSLKIVKIQEDIQRLDARQIKIIDALKVMRKSSSSDPAS